ncbi:MAG: GNAT family N-acetyltransferase [bacterium]|nr:GNAT family N-acetyltransferase [bacterium]
MNRVIFIRKVQAGDESVLAYIQTESWKAAFQNILDKNTLDRYTNMDQATSMYKKLLEEKKGNGYILTLDGQPHCIAWWDAARDSDMYGKAELICIHSLPHNWQKGYGSLMMERVLSDMKDAGFSEVVLWVFFDNIRARMFYEAKGFCATEHLKQGLGAQEICYSKSL